MTKNVADCISGSNAHERARTDIAGSTGSLRFVAIAGEAFLHMPAFNIDHTKTRRMMLAPAPRRRNLLAMQIGMGLRKMKLCYWKKADEIPNFGDVLNPYIFEKLLPGTFDDDANTIFVGIGTLLEKGMGEALNIPAPLLANDEPLSKWIVVFGSGAGYYDPPTMDSRWKIYAVRGPLTADLLGLDPKCAVADPAILIRRLYQGSASKKHKFSLMPHHSNAGPVLESICNEIGIHYINPLSPVPGILDAIAGS